MLLCAVIQIDGSKMSNDLEQLAYTFGLQDMRQIYLVAQSVTPHIHRRPEIFANEANCHDMARLLISLAILNYALYVHKSIEIASVDPGEIILVKRQTKNMFYMVKTVDWCLEKVHELMKIYNLPKW